MAGVTDWTGVGAPCVRGEEPIETVYVVSVFLGGRVGHSLMIWPFFYSSCRLFGDILQHNSQIPYNKRIE